MKKIAIHSFLILFLVSYSFLLSGQKVYTIQVGNERLLTLCERLKDKNIEVQKLGEADAVYTNTIAHKIDSIIERSQERRSFIRELKRINSSALPSTFHNLRYQALNNRLKREDKPLAADFAYCNVIQKVLSLSKKFKENKKVYFATDKYKIPATLKPVAKEIYRPAIDDIIRVANQFKDLPFTAVLRTTGYSDNKQVSKSSDLYADMSEKMQTNELSNDEINTYLSYLRSYDVSDILRDLMSEKSKYLFEPKNLDIDYEKVGKGNKLPISKEKAMPNKKRRVVYVYWHILPNF